jgi:carbamoyltransferase
VIVLGISPLDKDATASLVEDGRVVYAASEERFSRRKQQSGFPAEAIQRCLDAAGVRADEIDKVAYPFLTSEQETRLMEKAVAAEREFLREHPPADLQSALAAADARVPTRTEPIHGLATPDFRMTKSPSKRLFYRLFGASQPLSTHMARLASKRWVKKSSADHRWWQRELEHGLAKLGISAPLERSEHHLSHAANAYHASGFERALIVTLDGYGSGLAGSISLGEGGKIRRLHGLKFPHSLGSFYEMVTSSLGFHPDRHAGKVVGLAAYGDPAVLTDLLLARADDRDGDLRLFENLNVYFSRHLAARYPVIDVAAAYQHTLEIWARGLVSHWLEKTGCDHVVLSGGVTANVKMNQRIHEVDGLEGLFVYPNMGDGGCGAGIAMHLSWPGGVQDSITDVYWGPSFSEKEMEAALEEEGLSYERPAELARHVATRIHEGDVVARFDGRMEFGPRALGNRSILYHGRDPGVNQWLNQRLGRTEFMPFAPVTLWEARSRCYLNLKGAEHTAEFMTVTFDCTDWMKESCPAAVHVDGTARPQLVQRENNPGYYDIIQEYEKLSGIPCLINTSFNMHEEPIVCSPKDAVRAFVDGQIDGLVMGPFYASSPGRK